MPMAGKGSRFIGEEFNCPKPLIQIKGYPFFYWSVQSIKKFIDIKDLIFIVLQEHKENFSIDVKIKEYYPEAIIHIIPEILNGAALTCMEGIKEIHDDDPIVFNDCDHMFRSRSFEEFAKQGLNRHIAGGLLTFISDSSRYSFLKMDGQGNVIATVEKEAVSDQAICGCYYFRDKNIFAASVQKYLKNCNYQEYFVSGVYNIMASEKKRILAFPTDFHVPFGVPEEYKEAKSSFYFKELQ